MVAIMPPIWLLFVAFTIVTSCTPPVDNENNCDVSTEKPDSSKPLKCPINEESVCRFSCPPDTCDSMFVMYSCARMENQTCTQMCTCIKGYLRNNGTCVPEDRCLPPECADDPNAVRGCGDRCGKTCADYNKKNDCDKIKRPCMLYGCECKDGFVYDANIKKCVRPCDCTIQCTKPHERYTTCLVGECVPKTCDELGKSISCPRVDPRTCVGGCICEEDYVRNSKGDCIEKKKCPSCGGDPNAESGCGNPCGKTCDTYNVTGIGCPQYCLVNGCDCKEGYLLDTKTNKCILIKDCPKPGCGGDPNAVSGCGNPCGKTCADYNKTDLVCPQYCKENGCDCKPGFVLNTDTNKCVAIADCPKAGCGGDPNAVKGCGNPCGKTCADYNKKGIKCPKFCKADGCDCKPGFVLNTDTKKCVPIKDCPKPNRCPKPNERYSECLLAECVPRTCDELGKPIACPSIAGPCAGGCICDYGYVKNCDGVCIEMTKCPSCGGDPNAISGCGNPCGKTCADRNKTDLACPEFCILNGCDCRDGFLLNTDTNKCVPKNKCPEPKCTGPHEHYIDCLAGQCVHKNCDDIGKPILCPRIRPPCPGGCICDEGYLRNSKGVCIKEKLCPQNSCNANQTWVTCNVKCPDAYCPEDDQPQPVCDAPMNCPPGCQCKTNYKLNKDGKCILASECPPVKCTGKNEVWNSCPSASDTCEDPTAQAADSRVAKTSPPLYCQPRCVCEKGFCRNSDGICVPIKQIPAGKCKDPNAEWKDCPPGRNPCPGTCQNTKPVCASGAACHPGCECKEGYVLSNPKGVCVKIESCADYANCCANETFVSCTFKCPQVMCPESDAIILCKPPRDCPGGCGCKPNYRYNADGKCILASECPPVECTRPNEEWASCPPDYRVDATCEDRYNTPPIVDNTEYCNPGCICKSGFFKNSQRECIAANDCP